MNDNDTLADELRKDGMALRGLLADEKHKSEALAAHLAESQDRRLLGIAAAIEQTMDNTNVDLYTPSQVLALIVNSIKWAPPTAPETTPEQIPCSCGPGDCNQRILAHNEYCTEDRERAGLAQSDRGSK